jgi:hypothetical protein
MSNTKQNIWDNMDIADKVTYMVHPLHEVRCMQKLDMLTEHMMTHGWVGRPVAVLHLGHLQALTGSHRLAAAEAAGLEMVPTVIEDATHIDMDDLEELWTLDDADKGPWLRAHGLDWTADLLALESDLNEQ